MSINHEMYPPTYGATPQYCQTCGRPMIASQTAMVCTCVHRFPMTPQPDQLANQAAEIVRLRGAFTNLSHRVQAACDEQRELSPYVIVKACRDALAPQPPHVEGGKL